MKDPYAVPLLIKVLEDASEEAMVRHEAAEALGAIGHLDALPVLQQYRDDPNEVDVVRQTCELAVAKIEHEKENQGSSASPETQYFSVDPAPPLEASLPISELEHILLDQDRPLFERYRAMFSLRNRGGKEAVLALAKGFQDPSALFRHEIAYVFGQMQDEHSVEALTEVLQQSDEMSMVRHECAEALGSIASKKCLPVLESFRSDPERVVSESCVVALDMYAYEQSGGEFHYVPNTNNDVASQGSEYE
jgi:deoxyhypusine monooxygenase